MGDGNAEKRQISSVAAAVVAVAIGAVMGYFGFRLASVGVYFVSEGSVLLGIAAVGAGVVLVGLPLAVLVSQGRWVYRRRG